MQNKKEDICFLDNHINTIICGDALETLKKFPDESINCCITSPPYYGLRDYHKKEQIGREKTVEEYLDRFVAFQKRWNELLPDLPLYSNEYHDFFNNKLKGYEGIKDSIWDLTSQINYCWVQK